MTDGLVVVSAPRAEAGARPEAVLAGASIARELSSGWAPGSGMGITVRGSGTTALRISWVFCRTAPDSGPSWSSPLLVMADLPWALASGRRPAARRAARWATVSVAGAAAWGAGSVLARACSGTVALGVSPAFADWAGVIGPPSVRAAVATGLRGEGLATPARGGSPAPVVGGVNVPPSVRVPAATALLVKGLAPGTRGGSPAPVVGGVNVPPSVRVPAATALLVKGLAPGTRGVSPAPVAGAGVSGPPSVRIPLATGLEGNGLLVTGAPDASPALAVGTEEAVVLVVPGRAALPARSGVAPGATSAFGIARLLESVAAWFTPSALRTAAAKPALPAAALPGALVRV